MLGHVLEWTLTAPLVLTGRLCAGVLWSISPRLVLLLLLYTGLGTWITTSLFGRKCAPPPTPSAGGESLWSLMGCVRLSFQ